MAERNEYNRLPMAQQMILDVIDQMLEALVDVDITSKDDIALANLKYTGQALAIVLSTSELSDITVAKLSKHLASLLNEADE